jgi:phosphoglucomutase
MVSQNDLKAALDRMILSASGWRGIFALSGEEEDKSAEIPEALRIIAAAAALVFAEYMRSRAGGGAPLVLSGCDTRPTGKSIAAAMIPVLLASGCEVRYAGFTAAPEIMAWARAAGACAKSGGTGFIFISASHNPIGHNGLKFGLDDGGVLPPEETKRLIKSFRSLLDRPDCVSLLQDLLEKGQAGLEAVYTAEEGAKAESRKAYFDFSAEVAWGASAGSGIAEALKQSLGERPLGLAVDFNGSARSVSIDASFFSGLGFRFQAINAEPGKIAHRIVPEGESLEPCRLFLEELHRRDESYILGYVPDCDGDRGNLVIWDETIGKGRSLEAQEVFALACVAELAHLVYTGELRYDNRGNALSKAAVAVNDPTSMRIDRIATAFDVPVFRAEVGEANVVSLARRLREKGCLVRILGEGSNGGNITHPSAVRDPLHTVIGIAKLLGLRSAPGKPGLFELWCDLSDQAELYREDYGLTDIIASLPPFVSTSAFSEEAVLRVNTEDHRLLKDRYQNIFLGEWEERKEHLKARYGIQSWEAIGYNGTEEKRGLARFGESDRGGLKICFRNGADKTTAFIRMRGSATEPLLRVMADAEGQDRRIERDLIEWQRRMVLEADRGK